MQNLESQARSVEPLWPQEVYWDSFPERVRLRIQQQLNLLQGTRPLFEASFIEGQKSFKLRMVALPLSLAAHVAFGLFLIILPLINPGPPPPTAVYTAFLAPAPPPPPPPPPAKKALLKQKQESSLSRIKWLFKPEN